MATAAPLADDDPGRIAASAFIGADLADSDALLAAANPRTYPDGAVLCRQGDPADTFFVITNGVVALTQQLGDMTRNVALRQRGEFFGEMGLLEGRPRSATATAQGTTTVLEVSEAAFQRILGEHPKLALALVRGLVANVRAADLAALIELQSSNLALKSALDSLQHAQAGLVQKERLERELEIAGQVQRSLLPPPFDPRGSFSFAGRNRPARHVGGDLFDVIAIDSDRVALVLADVSDKGVQAALFMAVTRTLFRAHAGHGAAPAEVAAHVHRSLRDLAPESDMFVTAFYGELDLRDGSLRYVRAGHDEPLLCAADGSITRLTGRGRFLGAIDGFEVAERDAHIEPGGAVIIYSDGITDATAPDGRTYPLETLTAVVTTQLRGSAEAMADAIMRDVAAHTAGSPLADDVTVLVVKRDAV